MFYQCADFGLNRAVTFSSVALEIRKIPFLTVFSLNRLKRDVNSKKSCPCHFRGPYLSNKKRIFQIG